MGYLLERVMNIRNSSGSVYGGAPWLATLQNHGQARRNMRISSVVLVGLAFTLAGIGCSSGSDGGSGGSGGGQEPDWTIDAGALKLLVTESPWNMAFFDAEGNSLLVELPSTGDGPSGSLAMHLGP
ncbi:MAG: hypothetical protein DRH23_12440, partial [Deltaproteobacteria bacterium]